MKTLVCVCDSCKKETDEKKLTRYSIRSSNASWFQKHFDVCDVCEWRLGICGYTEEQRKIHFKDTEVPRALTVEEFILEALREDIEQIAIDAATQVVNR